MSDVNVDIYLPRLQLNEEERFVKAGDVVITRDRYDPEVLILDVGGDVGELFFRVSDFGSAMRMLEWH